MSEGYERPTFDGDLSVDMLGVGMNMISRGILVVSCIIALARVLRARV